MKVLSLRPGMVEIVETDDKDYPLWRHIEGKWQSFEDNHWRSTEHYGDVEAAYQKFKDEK